MSCNEHKELLERWWNDQLTETERAALKAQLAECEDCLRELEGSSEMWKLMGQIPVPEPSADMQLNFNALLDDYKASAKGAQKPGSTGIAGLWLLFRGQPWLAAAFSFVLIAGGFGLGYVVNRPAPGVTVAPAVASTGRPPMETTPATPAGATTGVVVATQPEVKPASAESKQLAVLSAQVHEMREMMMLSLLQNPSASERMRGVSYTSDIRSVNSNMAMALLTTLNNDPNVNVRLTTLEALTHFAGDPTVRAGLVESILHQESPLVQAALADVMLKLQERRAVRPFKKLLQQKDLNEMVRDKIEKTITRLT